MIVVSNTSPIINLNVIRQIELLKKLYGEVTIPQAVYPEVIVAGTEQLSVKEI